MKTFKKLGVSVIKRSWWGRGCGGPNYWVPYK